MTDISLNTDDTNTDLEFEAMNKPLNATEQVSLDLRSINTTSGKIRYLTALGWPRGSISKYLSEMTGKNIRYQHVRNVQKQEPKKTSAK